MSETESTEKRDSGVSRHPRSRRWVILGTGILGALLLGAGLASPPASLQFYASTVALSVVWIVGSMLALAPARPRLATDGAFARSALLGFTAGGVLLLTFLAGAVVVAQVEFLVGPVERLLANAVWGALPVVTVVTVISGVAEEYYFRGALFELLTGSPTRRILLTTCAYTLITAASGIVLLVFAAALLGLTTGWLRHRSDGLLAPVSAHLTWSVGMLYLLPPLLEIWS